MMNIIFSSLLAFALLSGPTYEQPQKKTETQCDAESETNSASTVCVDPGSDSASSKRTYPYYFTVSVSACDPKNPNYNNCDERCPDGGDWVTANRYIKKSKNAKRKLVKVGDKGFCEKSTELKIREEAEKAFATLKPEVAAPSIQPPNGLTLANLPTVFSSNASTQEIGRTLVGANVVLRVIPTDYHWVFGDGESLYTDFPGRPYPAMDITHPYRKPGVVHTSVTVTYRGEYTVNGGPAQAIDGTISNTSPTVDLTVREARGQLVRPDSSPSAGAAD